MNINRRDFLAACGAFAATNSLAKPTKGLLGSEGISYVTEVGSKLPVPYVSDGIVAFWDGIFNAIDDEGAFVHDSMASTWLDLSGNGYDMEVPAIGATWLADSMSLVRAAMYARLPEVHRRQFTIECVGESSGSQGALVWMNNPSWIGGALICLQAPGICWYPWKEIGRIGKSFAGVSLKWREGHQALCVNGDVVAETFTAIDDRNVLSGFHIGEYYNAPCSTARCCCVRLYDRELTDAEVAYNHQIDQERFGVGL